MADNSNDLAVEDKDSEYLFRVVHLAADWVFDKSNNPDPACLYQTIQRLAPMQIREDAVMTWILTIVVEI